MQKTTGLMQSKTMGSVASHIASYAISRGVPLQEILSKLDLDPVQLLAADARLHEETFPKIMNLMAESLPNEAFSLDLAKVTPFSALGFVSSALEFAPTFKEGLEVLVQYQSVLSDRLSFSFESSEVTTRVQLRHPMDALDRGITAELGCALLFRMVEEFYGVACHVQQVSFMHKPLVPLHLYEEYFGVTVLFEQPSNGFLLANEALKSPSRLPSKPLYDYARAHLDRLHKDLEKPEMQSEELQRVYDAICENAALAEYGAPALAQRLNMSLRSLQRIVSRNGAELREMLEDVRLANAKQLLGNSDLTISSIAHMLGYSEERAFRRLFKRWTDQTPSEFRRAAKETA
ncbi:AraC family transcriptional regulator ligand-binding domain-containing protein (plasmid) [Microbulbifer sp. MKSA007]|nr:AraC family transcriptional regulator ligand-binding domain-containing protein [Microbulbifer sp. MKSA007]